MNRAAYIGAMRRLRALIRALSAVVLALLARVVIDGPSPALTLTGAVIVLLLIVSGLLWRYGRKLEPRTAGSPDGGSQKRTCVADRPDSD
jgi:hypothetical protein